MRRQGIELSKIRHMLNKIPGKCLMDSKKHLYKSNDNMDLQTGWDGLIVKS